MFGGKGKSSSKYSKVSLDEFSDDSSNEGEGNYVDRRIQAQQEQLKKQDQGLELLSQSADRLGMMSLSISQELDSQNQILDDMDEDLADASDNLDIVTRKTKELIEKAGGQKNFVIIAILSLTVIVLLLLVIYS